MSRVYLELLNEDHFDDEYVGWHSQSHTDFYSGSKRIFTKENLLEEFHSGIKKNNNFHYGIFYKENNKLIGVIKLGIVNWVHKISDLIVFIGDADYLGKGLAVDAINEFEGVITSSPFLTPKRCNDKVRASVPLFNANANRVPQILAIFFSNLTTSSPPTQFPVANVLSITFNKFFLSERYCLFKFT